MSLSKSIQKQLYKFPEDKVFDYSLFASDNFESIAKTLSRLAAKGDIKRLSKGQYYKPRESRFGPIRISEKELINSITEGGKKGYITGITLFNQMGLTTQVPNTYVIANNTKSYRANVEGYKIRYVKQSIKIEASNVRFLQILDILRDIKEIPDSKIDNSLNLIIKYIKTLDTKELIKLRNLAEQYNPATKALLGAIFEFHFSDINTIKLKSSLNPFSTYKIGISEQVLPSIKNWKIL